LLRFQPEIEKNKENTINLVWMSNFYIFIGGFYDWSRLICDCERTMGGFSDG